MLKAIMVDKKLFPGMDMEKELFAKEGIELVQTDIESEDDYVQKCKDADAILVLYVNTPKNVIDRLEKCKVIVRYGVGYEIIDVDACSKKGIAACNIPHYCAEEVAAHTSALALDCLRKVTLYNSTVHKGQWNLHAGYHIRRLSTLTFGLCGFGNIARTVAKFIKGFGFKIIAYDPFLDDGVFASNDVQRVSFDDLCKTSDVISIHVPMSAETNHLFAKPQFDIMKKGVIIVNTSRGGLVCQNDLLDAIDSGIVKAAGLDVIETEPLSNPDERILKYDNVVLSPHAGAVGIEAIGDLRLQVVQTAIKVLKGELPYNVLNKKELQSK